MRDGISGRDIAVIAGGIAVGVIGSRLLAPMIAMGTGALKSRYGSDPFDLLIEDHRMIQQTLHEMEQAQDRGMGRRARLFLALKRKLAKHSMAEEDVVYPMLNDEAQRRDAAKHLYDEHADIKIRLYEIEQLMMKGEPWTEPVRDLRQLIERHIREEEDEQFPRLRQTLNQQRYAEVSAHVHREEAMIL